MIQTKIPINRIEKNLEAEVWPICPIFVNSGTRTLKKISMTTDDLSEKSHVCHCGFQIGCHSRNRHPQKPPKRHPELLDFAIFLLIFDHLSIYEFYGYFKYVDKHNNL